MTAAGIFIALGLAVIAAQAGAVGWVALGALVLWLWTRG